MAVTGTNLQRELVLLRSRLQEAEETLQAIRTGLVDALVVRGPEGDKVYTLKGAEEPYRLLVERMGEGALTLSSDGEILYSNGRFAELVGVPLEQVTGKRLSDFIEDARPLDLQTWCRDAAESTIRREVSLRRPNGDVFPVLLSIGALALEDVTVLSAIVTDLSEHKQAEEAAAAERFTRSILDQLVDPVVVCDASGRITHANRSAQAMMPDDSIGRPFAEALPLRFGGIANGGGNGAADAIDASISRTLRGESTRGLEVRLDEPGLRGSCFLLNADPLLSARQECIGSVIALTNITSLKRAEERQRVLLAELSHRVKNNLAIVQSVATQTLKSSETLGYFGTAFAGRLHALALAHSILTQTGWNQADLHDLLDQALSPYRHLGRADDIAVSGPSVLLPPSYVSPLSLVLHELGTNAVKYGALSRESGRIEIGWELAENEGEPEVVLTWRERNGPVVRPPTRSGLGCKLIERAISYELDGKIRLDYAPEGFSCVASFRLRSQSESVPQLDLPEPAFLGGLSNTEKDPLADRA